MKLKRPPISLGDRIRQAESTSDIRALLATGETYLNASDNTKARWRALAKRRAAQLQNGEVK